MGHGGDHQGSQQAHFDAQVSQYADLYGSDSPFHQAMTERFLAHLEPGPGMRVLDVGCGHGRTTIPLLRAGCSVVGLDLSRATLDALEQRVAQLGLASNFSSSHLPLEELDECSGFDAVVGRGVLHHLEDPLGPLGRVGRALGPGGRALFMDPNPQQPAWLAFITLHPHLSWAIERHVLRHLPGYNRRVFGQAGFSNVAVSYLGLVPPPLWRSGTWPARLEDSLQSSGLLSRLSLYQVVHAQI